MEASINNKPVKLKLDILRSLQGPPDLYSTYFLGNLSKILEPVIGYGKDYLTSDSMEFHLSSFDGETHFARNAYNREIPVNNLDKSIFNTLLRIINGGEVYFNELNLSHTYFCTDGSMICVFLVVHGKWELIEVSKESFRVPSYFRTQVFIPEEFSEPHAYVDQELASLSEEVVIQSNYFGKPFTGGTIRFVRDGYSFRLPRVLLNGDRELSHSFFSCFFSEGNKEVEKVTSEFLNLIDENNSRLSSTGERSRGSQTISTDFRKRD